MGHHAYTRVGGNWTDSVDTLTAADLESFEAKIFKSINGDDGGTWAPAGTLVIGGAGVDLQGANHVLSGTLTVDGDIQLDGVLEVGSGLGSVTFGGTTGRPLLGSRSLTRVCPLSFGVSPGADWANWAVIGPTSGGSAAGGVQYSQTTAAVAMFRLDALPNGATLNSVVVNVIGNVTGGAPGTMPTLKAWKVHTQTGACTQLGATTTDVYVDEATFEASHVMSVAGLSEVVDRTAYDYLIEVTPASGANVNPGFSIFAPRVTFTTTQMDDGAA